MERIEKELFLSIEAMPNMGEVHGLPFDEEIFFTLEKIVMTYEAVLDKKENMLSPLMSRPIKDLLEGLFSVLDGQVQLFYDNKKRFLRTSMDINPILVEKTAGINGYRRIFKKDFIKTVQGYIENEFIHFQAESLDSFAVYPTRKFSNHMDKFYRKLFLDLEKKVLPACHQIYVDAGEAIFAAEKKLENRDITLFYYEYLIDEIDLLRFNYGRYVGKYEERNKNNVSFCKL